jgi:enterochelin esterase-like enzyme
MKTALRIASALLLAALPFAVLAQSSSQPEKQQTPPRTQPRPPQPQLPVEPEVHPDGSVTFRFIAPNAKAVELNLEGTAEPQPLTRGADGIWSVTTQPLAPEYYGYFFSVDGQQALDPANVSIKTSLLQNSNVLYVPGKTPMPWEEADVPHGVVHHHFYRSAVVGINSDFYVYTPPNYDPAKKYPVLYLLHGYSDDASAWTAMGKANVILDNLLAAGRLKPMIVVMPLGYGTMKVITDRWQAWQDRSLIDQNYNQFTQVLLTEVMPQVERLYAISPAREDHAIAGLSMGGGESLLTGLNHLDEFTWVGAFSSAVQGVDYAQAFPAMNPSANGRLKLLWIACGRSDRLYEPNQKFIAWLQQQGVHVTPVSTPGMHEWPVWRSNLVAFAPLLFQSK